MCTILPAAFISGMPGGGEIIVLFLVILVLFGPRKLPGIARMIGKTLDQLRNASQDFKDEIMKIEDDVKEDIRSTARDVIDVESSSEDLPGESGDEEETDEGTEGKEDKELVG